MDENNNIIDVTGIGQIGCSLIERISELCGWLYYWYCILKNCLLLSATSFLRKEVLAMTRRLSTTLYQLQTKGAWDLLFEAA